MKEGCKLVQVAEFLGHVVNALGEATDKHLKCLTFLTQLIFWKEKAMAFE